MNNNFKIVDLFSRIIDLLLLNILFVVTSLPLFTLGASLCALSSTSQKMVRNEESYIAKNYFHSFRINFLQGTLSFISFSFAFVILFLNLFISLRSKGIFFSILRTLSFTFMLALYLCFLYYFPILARFHFSCRQVLTHIPHMIVSYPVYSFLLIATTVPLIFFTVYSYQTAIALLLIMCTIGASLFSYIESIIFRNIFDNYEI